MQPLAIISIVFCGLGYVSANEFPKDFMFGAATSAFQIEGAWNSTDKSESIWDRLTHTRSELIADGSNGDMATDSYHKYKEDVQLIKQIGARSYRISLSWPRILPNGFPNQISEDGVKYYQDFLDEMIKHEITPIVTIYHWDLPQKFQDLGGWANPLIVNWMEDYARVAFTLFGDRVKIWGTINEPVVMCRKGYGGQSGYYSAPAINQPGVAEYLCGHHVLLAHAKIYHLYQKEFRNEQEGKVGVILSCGWYEPEDTSSIADREAAERAYQFDVGWFAHPLFASQGDYPQLMKTRIAAKSKGQRFSKSRLPIFTREQIAEIKYSSDYIGINFYTAVGIRSDENSNVFGFNDDAGINRVVVEDWSGITWVKNTPWGFGKLLRRIWKEYNLPPIYIMENGYADFGGLYDVERLRYHHDHLQELLSVIKDGVNVKGYMVWSLIDNFEWKEGYTIKFGLFGVDFNHTDRPREPKLSAKLITEVYTTRIIPELSKYNIESNN